MRISWQFWLSLALAAFTSSFNSPAAVAQDAPLRKLIRNVTVIDVEAGAAVAARDVVIAGDRIAAVSAHVPGPSPADAVVIDGSSLFLIPGLFDAHVHLSASTETFAPLLIAHGVLAVRDTGADTDTILEMREASRKTGSTLPEIFCTGAIIDGNPPVWPFSEPCDTPEEARAAVKKLHEAGVDQIKVYSLLKPEVHRAAVEEAHARKLKVTGHIPNEVSLAEALALKQNCVEHLQGIDKLLVELSGEPEERRGIWPGFSGWLKLTKIDPAVLGARLAEVRDAGMAHCPTIVVLQGIGAAADREKANADDRMRYVPVSLRSFWDQPSYEQFGQYARQVVQPMQQVVKHMHDAGITLLVGSDLANPYVFAGYSVHEEMANFAAGGISNVDALRAATIVPAKFLAADDRLGSIAQGKLANVVLLTANPLEDIAHTKKIHAVIHRGVLHDRAALDAMLAGVASHVKDNTPAADAPNAVALDVPGEVIRQGTYRLKFQGQFDAGSESFVISRDHDNWILKAHNKPNGGMQSPSITTLKFDKDFNLIDATWEQIKATPVSAVYTIQDGVLVVNASENGQPLPEHRMEFPEGTIMSYPIFVSEFATTARWGMAVGESRTFQTITFGMPSWRPIDAPTTITREADETVEVGGNSVAAQKYKGMFKAGGMEMQTVTWLDAEGVPLKITISGAWGKIDIVLDP